MAKKKAREGRTDGSDPKANPTVLRDSNATAHALESVSCGLGQESEKHLTKPTREIHPLIASLLSFLSTELVGALSVHRVILWDEVGCMTRLARVVAVGVPHHVTQRGNARQFILGADADRNGLSRSVATKH